MEKSGFFPTNEGDRIYRSKDIAAFLSKILSNGILDNGCQVVANDNMTITVKKGYAFINGYWYHNDTDKIINIDIADANESRIDNIVLRYISENRSIEACVVPGLYATSPTAPSLERNNAIYDLRIAKINISKGVDKISNSMIQDCRFNSNDCGCVIQLVQSPDFTALFEKCTEEVQSIVNDIKNILSGDVAGNLINKINEINTKLITLESCADENLQDSIDNSNSDNLVLKDNENNILNPKIPRYETAGIVVTISEKQTISHGTHNVKFDSEHKIGQYFKLNVETNQIEVLKDCNALVSGNCFVDGADGDGYCWAKIFVNDIAQIGQLERNINRDYVNTSIPAKLISLKKGDTVYMELNYSSTTGNPAIRNNVDATFISIVKI